MLSKWYWTLLSAVMAIALGLIGCDEPAPAARLTSIATDPASATLRAGSSEPTQIRARGSYSDGTSRDVTALAAWTSSAPNVVVVNTTDARGAIRAAGNATGMANVTAALDGVTSGPTAVTVLPSSTVTALVIEPATATLPVGSTRPLRATATYADGRAVDVSSSAAWASADEAVARVAAGVVTGVSAGSAEVSAAFEGRRATAAVTVTSAALMRIEVAPLATSVAVGTTAQFRATGVYSDGTNQMLGAEVTWSSTAAAVATVGSDGVARGVAPGTATIRAEVGAVRGEASLVVTAATLRSIAVAPASATVPVGGTVTLTATGTYSDGTMQNITSLVGWVSADTSVATVSSLGQVIGLRAGGPVAIRATLGALSGAADVTVSGALIQRLEVTPTAPPDLPVGLAQAFTATAYLSDGMTLDVTANANVTWSSTDPSVATASNAMGSKGVATAVSEGVAGLSAAWNDGVRPAVVSPTVPLHVTAARITSLEVSPSSATVAPGFTVAFRAIGHFSDMRTRDLGADASVTWSSETEAAATVSNAADSRGVATGVAAGTSVIRARVGAATATATLRVTDATLASITVTPATATVTRGGSQQFTATGAFSDGSTADITGAATWESSDTTRATVANLPAQAGLATTAASATPGVVNVRARRGSVMGSAALTVSTALTLQRIDVTLDASAIPVGLTGRAQAVGTYTDGVSAPIVRVITNEVTWSITGGATVSNAAGSRGLVTGVAAGPAALQATLGGVRSALLSLTVTDCRFARVQIMQGAAMTIARGTGSTLQARAFYDTAAPGCAALGGAWYDVTDRAGTTWTSSNVAVVTVSNAEGARGVMMAAAGPAAPFYADVQVFYGALSSTIRVTVTSACVMTLRVSTPTVEVPVGIDVPFAATAVMSDGTSRDVTASASWTSSAPGVASVNALGVARTSAAGAATVTAAVQAPLACAGTPRGEFALTVTGAGLTGMSLSAQSLTLARGESVRLTATGTYNNGRSYDVTSVSTWRSSNSSVAAVSGGLVTANLTTDGVAAITAALGRLDASVTATVGGRRLLRIDVGVDPGFSCGRSPTGAWPVGVAVPLAATGHYSDGTSASLLGRVTWRSDLDALAVDRDTGVVTTRGAGTARLVAQAGSLESAPFEMTAAAGAVTRIEVAPASGWTMPVGSQLTFRATASFMGFAAQCPVSSVVTWDATATAPATLAIDPSGVAQAGPMGLGPATVRATLGTVTAVSTGAVSGPCVDGIVVEPDTLSTPAGVLVEATAYLRRSDGSRAPVAASWTTSNLAVATVTNATDATGVPVGRVHPLAAGAATVTASVTPVAGTACPGRGPTFTAAATLAVTSGVLTEVFIDCANDPLSRGCNFAGQTRPSYPAGVTVQCYAYGRFTDGPGLRDITGSVAWSSSSPAVASVSQAPAPGMVRTGAAGAAVITATQGSVAASRDLEVNTATLAAILVAPGAVSLPAGFTQWFTAEGTYAVPGSARRCTVTHLATWSSSSPAVATVSDAPGTKGRAQTVAAGGPASIAAAIGDRSGAASLTVNGATLTAIQISPPGATVGVGSQAAFRATGTYSDGSARDVTDTATWSTGDSALATVANGPYDRGLLTAVGVGSVPVRAAIGGLVGAATVTVTQRCVEGLTLSPGLVNVPVGVPVRWGATARWSDGASSDVTPQVAWSSSNPAALPAPTGPAYLSIARALGRARIAALIQGCRGAVTAAVDADVNAAALAGLVVRPSGAMPSVPVNLDLQMRAVGTYSDRTTFDITEAVDAWGVGNATVAQVSSRGVVTGRSTGATTVTATEGSISGTGPVTVTAAVVTAVAVRGLNVAGACRDSGDAASWVSAGLRAPAGSFNTRLRAIGTLSDGATLDLTEAVAWSSDAPSVAAVSNVAARRGEVTTGVAGNASLRATYGAVQGSLALAVVDGTLSALTINPAGPDPLGLVVGNAAQLTLLGAFGAPGAFCIDGRASWSSGAPAVASVDKGLVTALATGTALVTAAVGAVSDTLAVSVGAPALAWIEVLPMTSSLRVSDAAQLRAVAHYSDMTANDVTANTNAVWDARDVSGANVVAVDSGLRRGLVTALAPGQARVNVCIGAVCASASPDRSALVTVTR